MKIMIMTDLEGPSGINGRSDGIGNKTVNTPIACQVLMDEVNACVRGLLKGGAGIGFAAAVAAYAVDALGREFFPAGQVQVPNGKQAHPFFLSVRYLPLPRRPHPVLHPRGLLPGSVHGQSRHIPVRESYHRLPE